MVSSISSQQKKFQSTLSMRRATQVKADFGLIIGISIHALHEESDFFGKIVRGGSVISIHALHEESDVKSFLIHRDFLHFNPRSP
mgnify:CR=1 FL=1